MKKARYIVTFMIFFASFFMATAQVTPAGALEACKGNNDTAICKTTKEDLTGGILQSVIEILLYVAGTIAVIMIIVGAIRYITSDGEPQKAEQARKTIIYAAVGLVVAIMSFGIVNFVVGRL